MEQSQHGRRVLLLSASLAAIGVALVGCDVGADSGAAPPAIVSSDAQDGVEAGDLPADADAFDEDLPGIAKLDAPLREALQEASNEARSAGIEIVISSGWRSAALQERIRRDAVKKYGSEAEAARWVASPETSAHVKGEAVDVGSLDAASWLAQHGSAHRLCQTYANESWHFELEPDADSTGCPTMYADPTEDPRL